MSDPRLGRGGARELLTVYDRALPQVYGYVLHRCHGDTHLAEEITAEAFLAAVDAAARSTARSVTVPWLITVARNKLVDHWRQAEREERRRLRLTAEELTRAEGPWDIPVDVEHARYALAQLRGPHRAVLTLRYLDGLSVRESAELMQRSVEATEALIVRARAAFRRVYDQGREGDHA